MNHKPWWKSKTIWFNVLALLSAFFTGANEFLHVLEVSLDPKTYAIVGFLVAVANITLRNITTQTIGKNE